LERVGFKVEGLEREGLESEGLKGIFSMFANHIRNI
jgi:hypothetical protein